MKQDHSFGPVRTVLAWGVHLYTALGVVAAAGIAVLIVEGTGEAYRYAFMLMLAATIVDATDGTLARAVRVKEVLPNFDGRRLDDLVDYLNYAFLPLFLVWRAQLLPAGHEYWLVLPLLASAYGFCQVSVKTDDGYFLGFPSYWNLIALYLYVLQPMNPWGSVALIVLFSLLTFVPSRYLYPSNRGRLNRITNLLAGAWTALLIWLLIEIPTEALSPSSAENPSLRRLVLVSLTFPLYYLVTSWVVSLRLWRRRRRQAREQLRPAV